MLGQVACAPTSQIQVVAPLMPFILITGLQVLKQKRLYENQRDQLYNQQFNVEQTSFMMENVQDSVQTVQAMKAAGEWAGSPCCCAPVMRTMLLAQDATLSTSVTASCREGAPQRLQTRRAQYQQHRQAAGRHGRHHGALHEVIQASM
jgi:Snf7